ncbi:MAG: prepilin peptidase [Sedimentisphaerales bacterium]|nr:prepilin peptidase [Sedimentisphaerales bacterium]
MIVQNWIWLPFIFAWGCCIGSFLNVVIYRLPRDKSIVSPPSACPKCGEHIRFYDNIPLFSWILLGRKCRFCKTPISPRYFVIELLTGLIFIGLFLVYFHTGFIESIPPLLKGGWLVYLLHIILLAAFVAASAIDLELWIIPLSICWFVTAAGFIISTIAPYVIDPALIRGNALLPVASPNTGALALGAAIGLVVSMVLLATGLIKRSYESQETQQENKDTKEKEKIETSAPAMNEEDNFNHRLEALREIIFLMPIIIFSFGAFWLTMNVEPVNNWWLKFSQYPAVSGLLGSIFGYFIGCGIVWGIRIFGAFAFGKEAMGLGDVHLLGAAGAVVGAFPVVIAFFIAPFFGLAWVGCQMFFKKIRQIPYGPFLSLGILVVIILHDYIIEHLYMLYFFNRE